MHPKRHPDETQRPGSSWLALLAACCVLGSAACGSDDAVEPARTDAAAADAGTMDAQVRDAAGPVPDANRPSGSGPGVTDAETSIPLCGAQSDWPCVEDASTDDGDGRGDAGAHDASAASGDGARPAQATTCDTTKVMCKRAPPECPEFQVPSVVDTCYGECVRIDECVCHSAAECPDSDKYACHMSAQHCGPYVN